MVKTLNVTFEDKEFEVLEKYKGKYNLNWHDIILGLIKFDPIDFNKKDWEILINRKRK